MSLATVGIVCLRKTTQPIRQPTPPDLTRFVVPPPSQARPESLIRHAERKVIRCVLNPLRFSSGYSGLLCSPPAPFAVLTQWPKSLRSVNETALPIVVHNRLRRQTASPRSPCRLAIMAAEDSRLFRSPTLESPSHWRWPNG